MANKPPRAFHWKVGDELIPVASCLPQPRGVYDSCDSSEIPDPAIVIDSATAFLNPRCARRFAKWLNRAADWLEKEKKRDQIRKPRKV